MLVGIHTDPNRGFVPELEVYERVLAHNDIPYTRLSVNQPGFWEAVSKVDLFVFDWRGTSSLHQLAPSILSIVEKGMGIPSFPNMATWWPYDDKIREFYLLQQNSLPVIPTWIFWNKKEALAWLDQCEFPCVFKLKSGASSENVVLVRDPRYGRKLVHRMFGKGVMSGYIPGAGNVLWKDLGSYRYLRHYFRNALRSLTHKAYSPYDDIERQYVLFQKYLPSNPFDTRVTIIGNRAFFFRRHVRKNDFRASGSFLLDWSVESVDYRCIRIGFEISRKFGFQRMSYDFLYDSEGAPLISEMSYATLDWLLWSCLGFWDESLTWHEGHYWPQYCTLADLLGKPDLKQPAVEPNDLKQR